MLGENSSIVNATNKLFQEVYLITWSNKTKSNSMYLIHHIIHCKFLLTILSPFCWSLRYSNIDLGQMTRA